MLVFSNLGLLGQEEGFFTAGLIFVLKALWEFVENLLPPLFFSTIAPEFSKLKCIISFLLYFWAKNRLIYLFTYLFIAAAASLFFLVCSRDGRGVANKAAPY